MQDRGESGKHREGRRRDLPGDHTERGIPVASRDSGAGQEWESAKTRREGRRLAQGHVPADRGRSLCNKRILVVGGGDSAVEAAMGLASQVGNTVTVSYRQGEFSRIKERNSQDRK